MNQENKTIKMYKKKNNQICYMFKIYCGIDPFTKKQIYTTRRGFNSYEDALFVLEKMKEEIQARKNEVKRLNYQLPAYKKTNL